MDEGHSGFIVRLTPSTLGANFLVCLSLKFESYLWSTVTTGIAGRGGSLCPIGQGQRVGNMPKFQVMI